MQSSMRWLFRHLKCIRQLKLNTHILWRKPNNFPHELFILIKLYFANSLTYQMLIKNNPIRQINTQILWREPRFWSDKQGAQKKETLFMQPNNWNKHSQMRKTKKSHFKLLYLYFEWWLIALSGAKRFVKTNSTYINHQKNTLKL